MIVKFFVIQINEKNERNNKFIFEVDLAIPLMNGTTHTFDNVSYVVVEQRVFNEPHMNVVAAYCHEFKIKLNEENTNDQDIGYSER